MATIKAVSSKASLKRATDYITNKDKTSHELMDGINCNPKTARIEMETVQRAYEKTNGKIYYHYSLNYHKDDNITPEQCLKNARKLCEETKAFQGHQILIAVHTDKPHIHAHIIVSSVNAENGKKLQFTPKDLQNMKNRSDEISREQGLKVTQKGKTFEGKENGNTSTYTKEAYKSITDEKNSWTVRTGLAIMECKEQAISKEDFIEKMKEKGYEVKWTDKRKNITYTDIERQQAGEKKCSIRDTKLEEHFHINFGKESLTNEFERNAQHEKERTATAERGREAVERVYRSIGDSTSGTRSGEPIKNDIAGREQGTPRPIVSDEFAERERRTREVIAESRKQQFEEIERRTHEAINRSKQQQADIERDKREAGTERGQGEETQRDRKQIKERERGTSHER